MKKWLSLLLAMLMLIPCAAAFAQAAPALEDSLGASPFACPALPEEIHTQWQLFAQEPALELEMSALSDPETNRFVVILYNPLDWGIQPDDCISWVYDTEAQTWVADEETEIQRENSVVLSVDAQYYYMNGFPGWDCTGVDETFAYRLQDYSQDPNNPEYHLQYVSDTASIQMAMAGDSYSISSYSDASMSYCVYDQNGQLTLGFYMAENDDGETVNYAVIPNESSDPEAVAKEPYVLYYINVQTPDGGNYLWTEGAWQNVHGEEVAGPKGYSPDELPFELIQP
ncbi:MAG: hypothetical protein J6K73_09925 [Clostridia bacterium]|nr:hypothetical protein [Clostridia bacterium]